MIGLLSGLCLVGVKSCCLVLLSPSQGRCAEAPEQLSAPLGVTLIIPATIIYHLNGLHATVAAGGHFPRSSGRVMADSDALLGHVVVSVRLVPVQLPVLADGGPRVAALLLIGGGGCRSRRPLVHHLVLRRRAAAFVAHRRSILGIRPRRRTEVFPRLPGKTQVKGIERRVPLQEVVDL